VAGLRISGVGRLRKSFEDRRKKASETAVEVGFTANYAIYVHEATGTTFRAPGTNAKFLEKPAREQGPTLLKEVSKLTATGKVSMEQALLRAGLKLQRLAMKQTPIDTGNLRASAFTRKSK